MRTLAATLSPCGAMPESYLDFQAQPSSDWRADAKRRQREVLPRGSAVVSCEGPYGVGGLGRHLAELVEALRAAGSLAAYLTPQPMAQDANHVGISVRLPQAARAARKTPPIRFSPGLQVLVKNMAFDIAAARRLPAGAEHLLVFNGHAPRHIATARRLAYQSVGLISANAHLAHEAREFDKAWRRYPIEQPWAARNVRHNRAEYGAVDCIYVSSRYAWDSFVNEGFPHERLRLFPLTPHERFQPRQKEPTVSTFNVVYIGSLSVHKGVPLLVDAVHRLPYDDLRLILVGGWSTRGMRRHIEAARVADQRITVRPGDVLPHLLQAGVCVHPSYGEGYGYAPAEAMACGVPLIVSDNTGMTDLIEGASSCHVVPTDDLDALTLAIDAAYQGALRRSSGHQAPNTVGHPGT